MANTSHSTPYARLVALFSLSAFGLLMTLTSQLQEAATTTATVARGSNTLQQYTIPRGLTHHKAASRAKPACERKPVKNTTSGMMVGVRDCTGIPLAGSSASSADSSN